MAFTLGSNLTQWVSSASISAITFTGVAIPAGSTVVFGWSANVASLTATVADNSTQAGAANQYVQRPTLNGTTFTSQSIYCLKITRALLSTDTITITLTGGPVTRSAGWGAYWTPSNGNAQLENRSSVANAVASPVSAPVMGTTQWQASNDMAVLIGYWKGAGVTSGFANASVNMPGAGTHGSANSGGVTTRVEVNLASSTTMGSTAWTPSATYTSITVANVEGLTFTDNARPSAACVQYHSMPRGAALSSITAEIGPCTAGNLLLLAVSTNENAGADNITTPSGWTLAGTFRQGTTDVNMALFSKIAAGGETTQAIATSVAQRVGIHWSEWAGFTDVQDVTRSTAGSTVGVTTLSSGTVTPNGPGRLFYAMVTEKNAGPLTEGGGFGELLVNNEAGANSTQKIAMGIYSDSNRSTAATEQPTVATASGYAGMGFLFLPAATPAYAPATAQDRSQTAEERPRYDPIRSQVASVFAPLAVAAQGWSQGVLEPQVPFYRGAPSAFMGAADEPIPSASGWFQPSLPRAPTYYGPLKSLVVPVWDQPAAAPAAWSPVVIERPSVPYVSPRSLALIVAAPDFYAPPLARRQNGQPVAAPRSIAIPAYDNPVVVAADAWAQEAVSSRPPLVIPRAASLTVPVYPSPTVVADTWAQAFASRLPPPLARGFSSTVPVYSSPAAVADVWVQGLASRIVPPYAGSYSAFMGAADEPITADASWTPGLILARKVPYYLPPPARVVSPLFPQAAAPDAYTPGVIQSRKVAAYAPPHGFLVLGLDDHACTTLLPDTMLGPDTMLFPDLCPQTELGIVVMSRRLEARVGRSFVVSAYDSPAAPAYTPGVIRSWPLPLLERKLSVTRSPLGIAIVADSYATVTQSQVGAIVAPSSSTAILPGGVQDAYVPLARSSGSLAQVARQSLAILPRGELVIIVQAHVAPAQSRAVANYEAPLSQAITGLNPSPVDEVVNYGGGGEWVIWGKPDFPGNRPGAWPRFPRPGFKRPSRYEKRGY